MTPRPFRLPATGAGGPAPAVVAELTTPRLSGHSATVLLDGRVLVAGGLPRAPGPRTAAAELYEPLREAFVRVADMHTARGLHAAALLPDGRVLIAGGGSRSQGGEISPLNSAELFEPGTGTFVQTGSMQVARGWAFGLPLADGRVLVHSLGSESESIEIYSPTAGEFSDFIEVPRLRYVSAATLPDGRVVMAGRDESLMLRAVVFDPGTGTIDLVSFAHILSGWTDWSIGLGDGRVVFNDGRRFAIIKVSDQSLVVVDDRRPLAVARRTATLLDGGRIILAGGQFQDRWTAAVQVFEPETGLVTRLADLSTPRIRHTASLLPDGTVLIVGGDGPLSGMAPSTAELVNTPSGPSSLPSTGTGGLAAGGAGASGEGVMLAGLLGSVGLGAMLLGGWMRRGRGRGRRAGS